MSKFDAEAHDWDVRENRRERAIDVAAAIRATVPLDADMSLLEFGSGTGLLGFLLLEDVGRLTLADPSRGMLDKADEKIAAGGLTNAETWLLDEDAPTLPGDFDCIVTLMTLHHIHDYEAAIGMLIDHLRPGGSICLADLDADDGSFHDGIETCHHGIARADIERILLGRGLVDVTVSTPHVMRRERHGQQRDYPMFLITGRKSGTA